MGSGSGHGQDAFPDKKTRPILAAAYRLATDPDDLQGCLAARPAGIAQIKKISLGNDGLKVERVDPNALQDVRSRTSGLRSTRSTFNGMIPAQRLKARRVQKSSARFRSAA